MKDTKIYKEVNSCSISADIYYQGRNSPVILYIHGGALIFGERFNYYLYCRQHGVWLKEVAGINNEDDLTKLIQYNPINNITVDFPPTLFLHGDQDTDVPYEQSVLMHKKLKEKGVATKLIAIKGADHVFDQNFSDLQVQNAFEDVIDFLRTHL